ncbi:MAG: glycosyltransferase family 9 protein [Bacteroidota bacterium]|nr:glycosyltransferase family 9 protein [Bacteroidota bacterium]
MQVKFLIIRFSSIGDIVLTTPVIRGIKEQVEGAEVYFLTKPAYQTLLEHNPYLDGIYVLKNSMKETLKPLREAGFDYIIDLHHNLRTRRLKNKLKVLDFSVNKLNREKWMMVNFKKDKLPDKHIVERYLDCVSVFDVKDDKKGLDYFIPESDEIEIEASLKPNFLAFSIGGQHETKKLPKASIRKIVENIQAPVALLGGSEDEKTGDEIANELNHVHNYCGKLNMNQSAWMLKNAGVVISHDTGLMHIAAAFHKPILSIWGNTIPKFGMTPFQADKASKIFEVEGLSCRPCSKIGYQKCPKKHFDCMKKQDLQAIILEANKLLEI